MDDIKVTVYCLAYNHERYIKEALDGFVMQKTNFAFEVIVHDDASADATADIIREYETKYPKIFKPIYQKENQKQKNIDVRDTYILPKAKGGYIAICEGDDYWTDPYKLQKQFDALESHPECSICVAKVNCCNEDGSENDRTYPPQECQLDGVSGVLDTTTIAKLVLITYPFQTSSYFLRKEVFYKNNDLRPYLVRDIGTMLLALLCGKFYYINHSMSIYRLNAFNGWNYQLKRNFLSHVDKAIEVFYMFIHFDKYTKKKYCSWVILSCLWLIVTMSKYSFSKARELVFLLINIYGYKTILWSINKQDSKAKKIKLVLFVNMIRYFPYLLEICLRIFWKCKRSA